MPTKVSSKKKCKNVEKMKDVYVVDYQVRDCLGTQIDENYKNMSEEGIYSL